MVRRVSRKECDSSKYVNFLKVAENFIEGAKLAEEFEYYNAAGVLIIHSAIALADAVTIRFASVKCAGENHYEVIKLLKEAAPNYKETNKSIVHFEKLIDHKNAVSYQGEIYKKSDIQMMMKHYSRFSNWINSLFL